MSDQTLNAILTPDAKAKLIFGQVLKLSTGWFGRPDHPGGKVHVVTHLPSGPQPLCGTVFAPEAEYQWCSDGINRRYLRHECKRCNVAVDRMYARLGAK